jgi:hypothetical protein
VVNPRLTTASRADAIFNSFSRLSRSAHIDYVVLLAAQFVIIDEELFQFTHKLLAQVVDVLDVSEAVILLLHGYDSIIPFLVFLVALLTLNDSDEAALQETTGECWLVHQHQHIDGITIFAQGTGNETKAPPLESNPA